MSKSFLTQVLTTAVVVGLVAHFVCGQLGPAAIVIGNGLALSSTAVVLQVIIGSRIEFYLDYISIVFMSYKRYINTIHSVFTIDKQLN